MVANLSTNDLINLLNERGMIIDDDNAEQHLENIGYYKIKEYAEPFIRNGNYGGILFSSIIRRYYYDKNLRMHILDMIEVIELALKNKISYELGKLGAFNYLNFLNWSDTNKFSDEYIIHQQTFIKTQLQNMLSKQNKKEYKRTENFKTIGYKYNKNVEQGKEFPSIWLAVELLSFGQIQHLFELMTDEMKESISREFKCSSKMLESWFGTIVFARNQCAHNSNLVDVKLRTVPKTKFNWKDVLFNVNEKEKKALYSNRAASIILPIVELVHVIDPNYGFGNLAGDLKNLSKKVRTDGNNLATMIGFESKRKMMKFLQEHRNEN